MTLCGLFSGRWRAGMGKGLTDLRPLGEYMIRGGMGASAAERKRFINGDNDE
jgi:hypothetical protein